MQIYRIDGTAARPIDAFNSGGVGIAPVTNNTGPTAVNVILCEPGGVLGAHPAASNQLFLVVEGAGWVQAGDSDKVHIFSGQAAYWVAGEIHASGSETGMRAILLEGPNLKPENWITAG